MILLPMLYSVIKTEKRFANIHVISILTVFVTQATDIAVTVSRFTLFKFIFVNFNVAVILTVVYSLSVLPCFK